jgi:hypothetical protein
MPVIQDVIDELTGALNSIFSKLDVFWGFWHIAMESDDIKKTAFSSMSGHYEWNSPFWIKISSTYIPKNNPETSWKTFIQGLHRLFRRHYHFFKNH